MAEGVKSNALYFKDMAINSPQRSAVKSAEIIVGFLLCLTGYGALVGLPLMLHGLFSSGKTKGAWVGNCPVCDEEIVWYAATEQTVEGRLNCPACNVTLTFYNKEFHHIPPTGPR